LDPYEIGNNIKMPDFSFEVLEDGPVAGVDEAGRGALSGPVVAAAVIFRHPLKPCLLSRIDDSKRLKPSERNSLNSEIRKCGVIGIGAASVTEIEKVNILNASMLAMRRAVLALPELPILALIDGNKSPDVPCRTRTLIRGDTLSVSIAAASIIAKVARDRIMGLLSFRYPCYGWKQNAGYGTREHLAALKTMGATGHHRRFFAPVNKILSRN
jgi:ribonuclease HII